jgi:hypothetical protein
VTITPASERATLAGPLSSATMRLADPAVDGTTVIAIPPRERAAARMKSAAPPTAPT